MTHSDLANDYPKTRAAWLDQRERRWAAWQQRFSSVLHAPGLWVAARRSWNRVWEEHWELQVRWAHYAASQHGRTEDETRWFRPFPADPGAGQRPTLDSDYAAKEAAEHACRAVKIFATHAAGHAGRGVRDYDKPDRVEFLDWPDRTR